MNNLLELLKAVDKATEAGRLAWEPLDNEAFRAGLTEGTIMISRGKMDVEGDDGQDEWAHAFHITVSDNKGRTIEDESFSEKVAEYELANKIFTVARKSAFKSNDVISKMIRSLQPAG